MFMYMVCKIFAIIFVQNDEVLKKTAFGKQNYASHSRKSLYHAYQKGAARP